MSLYDSASLVMIPSGVKEDKLYSIKPTDGSGDLDFTRSNDTATRVGPDGLIEKVRTNLVLRSQEIDNAAWIKSQLNTTGTPPFVNVTAAPDGTLTADKIIANTANAFHNVAQAFTLTTSGLYTASAFVKAAEESVVTIRFRSDSFVNGFFASFNLITNTTTSGSSGTGTFFSAKIEALADGWFRISASGTIPSGSSVNLQYDLRTGAFAGNNSDGLFIWGCQLETTDFGATPYIPTTTAAVSVGPVADLPRLDYHNPDSPTPNSCPSLLLEPQRVNTLTFSEQLDNAAWSKLNATIVANDIVSPDGNINADRITDDAVSASHAVFRAGWDTTQRTASVYAKAGTSSKVYIINGTTGKGVFADLSSGTFVATVTFTGTLTNVGNGWYRITATHTAAAAQTFAIGLFTGTSSTVYVGTGSFAYLWGAQLEAGSYPTSYIPTYGTSAGRGVDKCSKTGISSLIGQTEGTLFLEMTKTFAAVGERYLAIGDGTGDNRIIILAGTGGFIKGFLETAGGIEFDFTSAVSAIGTHKIAIAYANNDLAMYIDGVQVTTDSSVTIPAVANLYVGISETGGTAGLNGAINQALLFKTRLSNTELAALTTL